MSLDRDQTQIEPFSPRHNVVVGRNGSGKSNFFAGKPSQWAKVGRLNNVEKRSGLSYPTLIRH